MFSSIEQIAKDCVNCGICVKECAFLQEYGSPQTLAIDWQEGSGASNSRFPFECSLCGLCHGVCPKNLDPSAMFLTMRRQLVSDGAAVFKEHRTIRSYEKRGSSSLLSWFHLPKECNTVLFPGCALPGSRPRTLKHLYHHLENSFPNLGLVLDCCTKPSHDLGDTPHFQKMFGELHRILIDHGVKKVLVACPNCYRIFKDYGTGLEVETVYEKLAQSGNFSESLQAQVTVHDPCGVRFAKEVQESARKLVQQQGLSIEEMEHSASKGFCCGEGGSAGFLRPDFAGNWTKKRVEEAGTDQIISYCAGCTHFLGNSAVTHHLLDLLFFPQKVMQGKQKVSKAPFTYWNRYRLRKYLQKLGKQGVCGTRDDLRD